MRKSALYFLLGMLYAPYAVSADGVPSRAIPVSASTPATVAPTVSDAARTIASRAAISRVFTGTEPATSDINARSANRVVNLGNKSDDAAPQTASRNVNSVRNTASRTHVDAAPQTAREKLDAAVNTVGRTANDINSNPAVRRAGLTLRPTVAELGGRATIGDTGVQTGSNVDEAVRAVTARAGLTTRGTVKVDVNEETITEAKERLEQTADLNKSCQEQYNECMDQFCSVIDANQKRCSCSANLSKYTKVEEAVKDANTQLNDVAQRIRYVGLSADEIRAIMNATEAEEELSGKTDTTETRNMLAEIEELIKDPTTSPSYSGDTFGLDMDLDFSSDSSELFNLDFLTNNTGSFSNLRGTELYNAAKKRCNRIINECKEVGATAQQITGNYDLAIDKDCIAYEQGLIKMNETLVGNVRSANLMLQKARLAVLQNKNQYDAKGCIAALDNCMRDEMVCGEDYTKCLDPTKQYIDENGNVVLGQNITNIIKFMEKFNAADIDTGLLKAAYSMPSVTETACAAAVSDSVPDAVGNNGACIMKYLLQKIGTKQNVTDEGLCRAVLDKCQMYTYRDENYQPYNDVVVNYIQRAMVNIRAAQHQIISDYSASCMLDIAQCYNQQVTQVNAWTNTANIDSIYRVMRGACRNVALTCAYAVFDNGANWCPSVNSSTLCCPSGSTGEGTCINNISEMFYQSLLCPDNSTYKPGTAQTPQHDVAQGYANSNCKCNPGYDAWSGACLQSCGTGTNNKPQVRNPYGTCVDDNSTGT